MIAIARERDADKQGHAGGEFDKPQRRPEGAHQGKDRGVVPRQGHGIENKGDLVCGRGAHNGVAVVLAAKPPHRHQPNEHASHGDAAQDGQDGVIGRIRHKYLYRWEDNIGGQGGAG